MPNLSRRREHDIRAGRFESEVSQAELQDKGFAAKRKFSCGKCKTMYEEKSRYCPRCDSHTMGELRPMQVSDSERARSIERARHGNGARI